MDRARVSVDKSRDVATTVDGITPVSIRAFVQEVLVQDTSVFYATAGTAPTVYTVRVVTDGYVSFVKLVKPDNSWFLSICVGGHYYNEQGRPCFIYTDMSSASSNGGGGGGGGGGALEYVPSNDMYVEICDAVYTDDRENIISPHADVADVVVISDDEPDG